MTSKAPAVDHRSLGAWLIKGSPNTSSVNDLVDRRFRVVTTWCVRKTYRTDLIKPGQPVLFWVSGRDLAHPAGIYAQGRTTGDAVEVAHDGGTRPDPGAVTLVVPLELEPLDPPVLRTEILQHPVLRDLEVLRMPAGSNPSFLSRTHLHELRRAHPHVAAA